MSNSCTFFSSSLTTKFRLPVHFFSKFIHLLWFFYLNLAVFRVHAMFLATLNQHFIWHHLTMRMLSLLFFHSFFRQVEEEDEEEKCTKQLISSYGFACLSCYVCHHVSSWAKYFLPKTKIKRKNRNSKRRIRVNQTPVCMRKTTNNGKTMNRKKKFVHIQNNL